MNSILISGFSDEITQAFETQLSVLKNCGMKWLELRSADGVNVAELTDEQLTVIQQALQQAQIKVSSIGSPIGKIAITDPFEPHFLTFQRVVEIAKKLGTKHIRMFSFYCPAGEEALYRAEVFARLERFIRYAEQEDVVLLHENEKGIYGDVASRCLDLMQTFYGPHFQAVFDFANFVECGQDTKEAYSMLHPYIQYVHIKDASKETRKVVPAGEGDGQVKEILGCLKEKGYQGFLSLEPHLIDFAGLQNLEQHAEERKAQMDGETAWNAALNALRKILKELEWQER